MHIYVAVTKMFRLFSKIVYCKKIYTDVKLELGWGGGGRQTWNDTARNQTFIPGHPALNPFPEL
jgi:hypothetical protein